MSKGVVERFEMIQVKDGQTQGPSITNGALHLIGMDGVEMPTVEQFRKAVRNGALSKFLLHLLSVGKIMKKTHATHFNRSPVAVGFENQCRRQAYGNRSSPLLPLTETSRPSTSPGPP